MVKLEGTITMLRLALTKKQKSYHQITVDGIFMFWWNDGDAKGLDIGDDVVVNYTPGKFTTLNTIEKIIIKENVKRTITYGKFMDELKMHKNMEIELIEKKFTDIDVDKMLKDLESTGDIYMGTPSLVVIIE